MRIIEKTKNLIAVVTKEDKEFLPSLSSFFAMKNELPNNTVYDICSCLPDGSPAYFVYDSEKRMLVVSYTQFEAMSAHLKMTFFCSDSKNKIREIGTVSLAGYFIKCVDEKLLKLISSKAKTAIKRVATLFPDKEKVLNYLDSIHKDMKI